MLASSAFVGGGTALANGEGPRIAETNLTLQPTKGTDVLLSEVRATIRTDGTASVSAKMTRGPEDYSPIGFEFSADVRKGTYSTRRLASKELTAETKEYGSEAKVNATSSGGRYFGRVLMRSVDPVGILLAQTRNQIWFQEYRGSAYVYRRTYTRHAVNPTALGTRWYIDHEKSGHVFRYKTGPNNTWSCQDFHGAYYNYDYGVDRYITTSTHITALCGKPNGGREHFWQLRGSGEDYQFIRARVEIV